MGLKRIKDSVLLMIGEMRAVLKPGDYSRSRIVAMASLFPVAISAPSELKPSLLFPPFVLNGSGKLLFVILFMSAEINSPLP